MNYNHRKPYIPPPPALPRFALPNEEADEAADPMDDAATAERPALHASARGSRRVLRRAPAVDAIEEVRLEDIALEVYAEDPPPPLARRAAALPAMTPLPARTPLRSSIANASDTVPPQGEGGVRWAQDDSSVAPVIFATTTPPQSRPVQRIRRPHRGVAVAVWSVGLVIIALSAGSAGVLWGRSQAAPAAASPALTPAETPAPPAAVSVPAVAPAAWNAPAVAIDSLPAPAVTADAGAPAAPPRPQTRMRRPRAVNR